MKRKMLIDSEDKVIFWNLPLESYQSDRESLKKMCLYVLKCDLENIMAEVKRGVPIVCSTNEKKK